MTTYLYENEQKQKEFERNIIGNHYSNPESLTSSQQNDGNEQMKFSRQKIGTLTRENRKLKEETKRLEMTINFLSEQNDQSIQLLQCKKEIELLERQKDEIDEIYLKRVRELSEENEKMKVLLSQKEEKIEQLKKAIYGKGLIDEKEDERKKCEIVKIQVDEKNKQIDELKWENDCLSERIMKLRNSKRIINEQYFQVITEVIDLSSSLKSIERSNETLKKRIIELEREKADQIHINREISLQKHSLENEMKTYFPSQ